MNSLKTSSQTLKRNSQLMNQQRFTLLELLDRLLDKGVMVKGEILLTVADIDLVYLNLGLILSSVKSVEKAYGRGADKGVQSNRDESGDNGGNGAQQTSVQEELFVEAIREVERSYAAEEIQLVQADEPDEPQPVLRRAQGAVASFSVEDSADEVEDTGLSAKPLSAAIDYGLGQIFQPKANIDPENVEKGLARLVLTLVELLRKLMEKQAVRRIDDKQLNAEEVERMGNAFFLLDKKMEQLKKTFDLKDGDLNLDLGPLGDLM